MKRITLLSATLLFIAGQIFAQSEKEKKEIEQEVKILDVEHANAVLRGDLAAMDKFWTEDFIVNNPFNEIDRADRVRDGGVTYASFIRESEAIKVHGNTVIVMGKEIVVPKEILPKLEKQLTAVIRTSG